MGLNGAALSVGLEAQQWRPFATLASGARLLQAVAALAALPNNPPEPLHPRLV